MKKKIIIGLIVLVVIAAIAFFVVKGRKLTPVQKFVADAQDVKTRVGAEFKRYADVNKIPFDKTYLEDAIKWHVDPANAGGSLFTKYLEKPSYSKSDVV